MARRHHSPYTHASTTLVHGGTQKRSGSPVRNLQTCRVQIRRLAGCSALFVAVWGLAGCTGTLPAAPGGAAPTLSGHIYQDHTASTGEPLLADAIVTVTDADGSSRTAVSDRVGFYKVSTRAGTISVSVSKDGYETGLQQVALVNDTVLNFSLTPSFF